MKDVIEKKLADYRQGLEWMQTKHAEAVKVAQTLEAAMLRQQGAIESLEGLLGEGEDGDQSNEPSASGDDAGGPGEAAE